MGVCWVPSCGGIWIWWLSVPVPYIIKFPQGSDQLFCKSFSPGASNRVHSVNSGSTLVYGIRLGFWFVTHNAFSPQSSRHVSRFLLYVVEVFCSVFLCQGSPLSPQPEPVWPPPVLYSVPPLLITPLPKKHLGCLVSAPTGLFGFVLLFRFRYLRFWTLRFLFKCLIFKQHLSMFGITGSLPYLLSSLYWLLAL